MPTARIYGDKVDVDELFVDCTITVDLDGTVTLEESTDGSSRTWTCDFDRFCQWREDDYVGKHDEIDTTHGVWDLLIGLYALRDDDVINDMAISLETTIEDLYRTIIRTMVTD